MHRAVIVACLLCSAIQSAEAFACRSSSKRLSRATTSPFSAKFLNGNDESTCLREDYPQSSWTRRDISKVFIAAAGFTGKSVVTWADEAAPEAKKETPEEKKKREKAEKAAKAKAEEEERQKALKIIYEEASVNRKAVLDAAEAKRSMTTADIIEAQKLKNKKMFGDLQEGNKKARGL